MGMSPETKARWASNYVRILKAEKPDPELVRRGLQKGFGIEHPERIRGFAGFLFSLGDVYVTGNIAEFMKCSEAFAGFVMESLKRFDRGDYGLISRSDKDENIENRCLFGIDRLFGRYGYRLPGSSGDGPDPYWRIACIRKLDGNTWVTYDSDADWFLLLSDADLQRLPDFGDRGGKD